MELIRQLWVSGGTFTGGSGVDGGELRSVVGVDEKGATCVFTYVVDVSQALATILLLRAGLNKGVSVPGSHLSSMFSIT